MGWAARAGVDVTLSRLGLLKPEIKYSTALHTVGENWRKKKLFSKTKRLEKEEVWSRFHGVL